MWVESIRRHSGQVSKRSSKVQATPIMAGMELQRLQLKGAAAQILGDEEVTMSGEILQREAYSYGRWYKRWAAVTETALFIFMEEGGQSFCTIPLRGAHLDKYIVATSLQTQHFRVCASFKMHQPSLHDVSHDQLQFSFRIAASEFSAP